MRFWTGCSLVVLLLLGFVRPAAADDTKALLKRMEAMESELKQLRQWKEDQALDQLRQSADSEGGTASDTDELPDRTYVQASRSLQMLNPEISVSGDFLAQLIVNDDHFYAGADDRTSMPIRAVDLHIQSTLDPFSLTKIAIGFDPQEGASLEEAFITWAGVVPSLSFTVGLFRQQVGVLNRWHEHDLDQTGYPLVLDRLFGEGGLSAPGLSMTWSMPALWADANALTVEVTDGSNDALYAGDYFTVPAFSGRLKSYWDLNEDTYLELGLNGGFGFHNHRGEPVPSAADPNIMVLKDDPWKQSWFTGADLTLFWQPLTKARYHSVTWRSEGYYARKQEAPSDISGWGLYSYLMFQAAENLFVGVRGDLVQPMGTDDPDDLEWKVVPWVTFWQSEFVYLRFEVQHGELADGRDTRFLFQVNWAAGPHKHEKY